MYKQILSQKTMLVIGGGYSGCLSALIARKIGFKVILLESKSRIFQGASVLASRLHLGGEYPKDTTLRTGRDCMRGAILFRQMFPDDVLTVVPPMRFSVSSTTQLDKSLTVGDFQAYYRCLQKDYTAYLEDMAQQRGEGIEEIGHRMFGLPEDFIKPLNAQDLAPVNHVVGGFQSQERGINIPRIGAFIEKALQEYGVDVICEAEVTKIQKYQQGFMVMVRGMESFYADNVVQSAWYRGFALDDDLRQHQSKLTNSKFANIYLRSMMMMDISRIHPHKFPAPTFVMLGKSGGMWCPYNRHIAVVYRPGEETAYVDNTTTQHSIPQHWEQAEAYGTEDQQTRLDRYFEQVVNDTFPFLEDAIPLNLVTRVTINFQKRLEERYFEHAESVVPGYISIYPTKATTAPLAALEAVEQSKKFILAQQGIDYQIDTTSLLLSDLCSLRDVESVTQMEAEQFAQVRNLSPAMAIQDSATDVTLNKV